MRVTALACCLLLCVSLVFGQNTSLRWYSFSSGFEISSSPSSRATSSIGQPFIGTSQGTGSIVISGFLADTLLRGQIVSVNEPGDVPTTYELYQNYPNPFNPTTIITYQLPASAFVTLKVFDIIGREVATLVSDIHQAGSYTIAWNAGNVASGVYFYRMSARRDLGPTDSRDGQAGSFLATRKLMVLR